ATTRYELAQPLPLIIPKYLALHASLQKPALNQNFDPMGIPKSSLQPSGRDDPMAKCASIAFTFFYAVPR
ncbi:MAG TPA: hypothetical protein VFL92_01185, partial [Sphingomonas sp.]|nr:hypothetical protein [Sphingomonas sp.]